MSWPPPVGTLDPVQSVAFAVPVLPGQAEAAGWRRPRARPLRKEAYQDARHRAGIVSAAVWSQSAPGGDVAVVSLAADGLATAFTIWGTWAEPFDRWFRGHAHQVHGTAWDDGFAAPELVLDYGTRGI